MIWTIMATFGWMGTFLVWLSYILILKRDKHSVPRWMYVSAIVAGVMMVISGLVWFDYESFKFYTRWGFAMMGVISFAASIWVTKGANDVQDKR